MRIQEIHKRGFVLLLTLVIMLTLSTIAGALIFALSSDFRAAAIQSNDGKAFWLAEAGIADAIKRLKNNEIVLADGNTDNSSIQNVNLGDGQYSVTLSRAGQEVTITSVGTVEGQTRTLSQIETVGLGFPAAFDYAVFGANGSNTSLTIAGTGALNVTITGDFFYDRPSLSDAMVVQANSGISGLTYTDSISGSGTYTLETGDPDPVPTYAVFDKTSYDNAITVADSVPRSDFTLSGSSTLNLAGGTQYYHNFIADNTSIVNGPGTIVVTGLAAIVSNATIGNNVKIISKTSITVRNQAKVNTGSVLYSRIQSVLMESAIVNASLISPEAASAPNVTIRDSAKLTGIIYAERINILNDAIINGSLVVNRFHGDQISGTGIKINYSQNYIPTQVPEGFQTREIYSKKANSWKEM